MWVRKIYRQMEGKEVYDTSGTWLHSLTENCISGTMQFITSRKEPTVKETNWKGQVQNKTKQSYPETCILDFCIFIYFEAILIFV